MGEKQRTGSISSESDDPPPYYEEVEGGGASSSAPPTAFTGTHQLQVQTLGYDTDQALSGWVFENISIYTVDRGEVEYISLRLQQTSNSCALVRGSDTNRTPLISTIYRRGPGRNPKIRILPRGTSLSVEEAISSDNVQCEVVDVVSRSIISRTQKFDTSFGNFEWRYGSTAELRAEYDANSLILMERVDFVRSRDGKAGKRGVRIAQLVRNDEFRTQGTSRRAGGNGGRLMMDLSMWADERRTNVKVKDVEAFVVASCLCMLKREADRFRDAQNAAVV
ncbi:unnamed protein product [Clonostachys rhizophaga]|uniref:Uncharacterized protein n=1 Tax=Clonostachys rhizophaga TaxID=160324 RepID=A0A9N9VTK2_9HYPO|nr:unnamed protein product [Clonostachys rhizophaga]